MSPIEERYLEQITIQAALILDRWHVATTQLEQSAGGYKSTVIGAAPPTSNWLNAPTPDPDADVTLTPVEAAAFRTDHARNTLQRLRHDLIEYANLGKIIERTITANWPPASQASQHAATIREDIDAIWCSNHLRHNIHEPKADTGGSFCTWCTEIRRPRKDGGYGHLPDPELIEARHRRGSINTHDLDQFLTRMRLKMSTSKKQQRSTRKGAA